MTAVFAFWMSDFADASFALFCTLRYTGMAIAARMPMMITTTRSSMSVKPFSLSSRRPLRRASSLPMRAKYMVDSILLGNAMGMCRRVLRRRWQAY